MSRAIDIVRQVAPNARPDYLAAFAAGDTLLRKHGITTPLRLAHFLAQVMHETDALTIEWENLSYRTPARLLQIFGQGNHSAGVSAPELPELLGNPQALAERVYGLGNPRKARELGNIERGDGFRYRGGGILQTTGRDNYRRMGQKCGVEFEAHPELVVSAEHALKPALAEWTEGNLNAAADRDDIVAITRKINGGLNGLADRRARLAKLRPLIDSVELVDRAEAPRPVPGSPAPAPGVAAPLLAPSGPAPSPVLSDLAQRIIAAMERKGYAVDRGLGEINIVYVEGMNADGTPNGDEANKWNDLRLIIRFEGGEPKIIGSWPATTEPGRYYTENPVNPGGAARIEFGQYRAWQVGMHRGDHESLVQTGGQVTVCRDLNKDGMRTGDKRDTGNFGINQHWGYDLAEVDKASAGCLVGQSKPGHRQFMAIVKSDPRYQSDRKYVFTSTVLAESDVLAERTPETPLAEQEREKVPVQPSDVSETVRLAQRLLGFPEEDQDGIYGAVTEEAVRRFQRQHGLPLTGDLDEATWAQLDGSARTVVESPARPGEPSAQPAEPTATIFEPIGLGVGTMNPLIMIAARVLPGIIQAVAGDKIGTVAGAVTKAVTEITQTKNPEEAQSKLKADPDAYAALQLKLAEIANDYELARRKAELELLKEQNQAEAKRTEANLKALQEQLEDVKNARGTFATLALANNPMAWGAPIVSFIVTIGFFGILVLLMTTSADYKENVAQIINITVGALAAGFATVISFWLGSSQGSRIKDVASIEVQERQVRQTNEMLERSVQQAEAQSKVFQSTIANAIGRKAAAAPTKAASAFQRCFDIVSKYETDENLKRMPRDDACEVYRTKYWNVIRCDDLPAGVDLVAFDFAVAAGTAESAKALQKIVGAKEDASIGDATIATVKVKTRTPADTRDVVTRMSALRRDINRGSDDEVRRISTVEQAALEMIVAASAVAV